MEKDLNSYLQSNWGIDSIPQNDPFESAFSSMVSSPTGVASNGGDRIMIKELIGRLGSICDSAETSCIATGNNSTSNSCYTTPLNSPPKRFNLSPLVSMQTSFPNLESLSPDPGFVERAAKLSCFGNNNFVEGKMGKVYRLEKGGSTLENGEIGDSREESSVSEMNPRKRKSISLVNVKDKIETEDEESNGKRSKTEEEEGRKEKTGDSKNTSKGKQRNNSKNDDKEASKLEAPKDYIHVRARRGQATDSHSLAERVRREKISERMNFLQDLVPGCNKVTGKATVLDEIINYVQSLQRQVEFLSMKLATVNPRMDFKDMFTRRGSSLTQTMYQLDENSAQGFPLGFHNSSQQMQIHSLTNGTENLFSVNSDLNLTGIRRNTSLQLASTDGFGDSMAQVANFWDDDLQSIVQMGITQNHAQSIHGNLPNAQMKAEL